MDKPFLFCCPHCNYKTSCLLTGVSQYGRVRCPKCKLYYKCYNIKCKICGVVFEPKGRIQEEIKKCNDCIKNRTRTPTPNKTIIEL